MPLIKCADCGREISDRAKACPHCGCPIEISAPAPAHTQPASTTTVINGAEKPSKEPQDEERVKLKLKLLLIGVGLLVIAIFLIVGVFSIGGSGSEGSGDYYSSSSYSGAYNGNYYPSSSNSYVPNNNTNHTHTYFELTTKFATCTEEGITTYSCICGHSYTKPIPKVAHDFAMANCTTPKKCFNCGATEGSPKEHAYISGVCISCGQSDPKLESSMSACSLQLPEVPVTINDWHADGTLRCALRLTDISYKFEYSSNGTVLLNLYFSGTKIMDYLGNDHNGMCLVGWKIYDASGNVFNTGRFTSPTLAVGDSFTNEKEEVLHIGNNAPAGAYRLELYED